MKFKLLLGLTVFAVCAATGSSQTGDDSPAPAKRLVVTTNIRPQVASTPLPRVSPTPFVVGGPTPSSAAMPLPAAPVPAAVSNLNYNGLSFHQIKARIAEAKREMQTRPVTIASVESTDPGLPAFVRIAYYDQSSRKIEYVVISKDAFLAKQLSTAAISTSGRSVTVRNIRANGVNTPIVIVDEMGHQELPLIVQYPVIRNNRYIEMAYYVSTHPGIVTPEVVSAGQLYVRNTIDVARDKLRAVGYSVEPRVADMAERLATVEHVDHFRFRTEYQPNIYNDIFTLYALNEGQTYRYSVSSAGAGGMVQMIPSTYRMIRARYPNANLMPDFVTGMQDHVNAAMAMLLYMQMTWTDLVSSPTITGALASGIAKPEQLMAAGYNSNPARLAGYISRGGPSWTFLIPRETQIYLQIYDSLERSVPQRPRSH